METVDTRDASHRLSELLDKVEQGEEVVITRLGKPIAKLVRTADLDVARSAEIARAVHELKELRKGARLDGLSWKELRDKGRRW
jgi:prevent-host-death family protein